MSVQKPARRSEDQMPMHGATQRSWVNRSLTFTLIAIALQLVLWVSTGCPVAPRVPEGVPEVDELEPGNPDVATPEGPPVSVPLPSALLVADDFCPQRQNITSALELFQTLVDTEVDVVVEIAKVRIVDECSGAGGLHALSSTTASDKRFWLGEHACYFDQSGTESGIGVGIGLQTQTLVSADVGWCVMYPDDTEPFASDLDTKALAWFETDDEAERFLTAVLDD